MSTRFSTRFVLAAMGFVSVLYADAAIAQTLHLVADLYPGQVPVGGGEVVLGAVGGRLLFTGASDTLPQVLYGTDGTAVGTEALFDGCSLCQTAPTFLGSAGGKAYVAAEIVGQALPNQLWVTNGTRAGSHQIFDSHNDPVSPPSYAPNGFFVGGHFYLQACDASGICGVWVTDGTSSDTTPVKMATDPFNIPTPLTAWRGRAYFAAGTQLWSAGPADAQPTLLFGAASGSISEVATTPNHLFFVASAASGPYLWASDGTTAGTIALTNAPLSHLLSAGDRVFFAGYDPTHGQEIWSSDGTVRGTRRETDFAFAAPFGQYLNQFSLQVVNGRPVFIATDGINGSQVWAGDGHGGPPIALTAVCGANCWISSLVQLGNRAVFFGTDLNHGTEPWATDGTLTGTTLLKDICPGTCSSMINEPRLVTPALVGNQIMFWASNPAGGESLWRTDGTPDGTAVQFSGIGSTFASSPVVSIGTRYFFSFSLDSSFARIWVSDGTQNGTGPVTAGLTTFNNSSSPKSLTALPSGAVVFQAWVASNGGTWVSHGDGPSTQLLTAKVPQDCSSAAAPCVQYVAAGSHVFFKAYDAQFALQLWATDGTAPGTVQLTHFQTSPTVSGPAALGDRVLFAVQLFDPNSQSSQPVQLWLSDGTVPGTQPFITLPPTVPAVYSFAPLGSALLFSTSDLWRTDGTASGTYPLAHLIGTNESLPLNLEVADTGSYGFFFVNGATTTEVWRTDGTSAGTMQVGAAHFVSEPVPLAGNMYFFAAADPQHLGLFRTNGSGPGLTNVKVFDTYSLPIPDQRPVAFNGKIYFTAYSEGAGPELWVSDGTPAGTQLLADICPGPNGSHLQSLTATPAGLFFSADDCVHGIELWRSDGTTPGTRMVEDLAPGLGSSSPTGMTFNGSQILLAANDGLTGNELWALPLNGALCANADPRLCLGNRFEVEAQWQDFQGHTGTGHAVALTPDTGYFWFFGASNIEALIKVLDGRGVNQSFWVFYGALSNVQYSLTVTDTQTGARRRYFNPLGRFGSVGDTLAFGPQGAFSIGPTEESSGGVTSELAARAPSAACAMSTSRLCLLGNRFEVEAQWQDFQGHTGTGHAVALTPDTGYFWFFGASNVETACKAIDGSAVNGKFWFFYGALSNVQYTITVTDTLTGRVRTYTNPLGHLASVGDTSAF